MIIVKIMGGLGNQMFQYALGRRLAYQHQMALKLDLTWFQTQKLRSYQLDAMRICADVASLTEIDMLTRSNWSGLKRRFHEAIQTYLPYYRRDILQVEQVPYFDSRMINKSFRNAYMIGYWQSEEYFKPIAPLLHEEFKLKALFSDSGQVWKEKIDRINSISLHVRHGDYINNLHTNKFHGICSLEYYVDAITHVRQRFPQSTIFVFSDDMNWARQHLDAYLPIEFVEVESENKDQEELMLMSLCDHHIIANSSYSWWGAWLGTYHHKIVVAPKKWFSEAIINTKDLIPTTWVRF